MTSPKIVECLGDRVEYARMLSSKMQVNLGCKQQPTCGDIVARLLALRELGSEPNPIVYRALAQGLETERLDRAVILSQPIFWNGSSFVKGTAILLSPKHRNHFLGLYDSGPDDKDIQSAFVSIGVATIPSQAHWVRLLVHLGEKMKGTQSVPVKLRPVFQDIYENLKGSPPELPSNMQCLLAENGGLYTMADARASRILIADQTDLAQAVRTDGIVALCDAGDGRGLSFFLAIGVKRLSEVARLIEIQPGKQVEQDGVRGLRDWIKSPSLRSAIKSIVRGLQLPFTGRLDALITRTCIGASGFVAVDRVSATYRIGQKRLTVSKPYVIRSSVVYVSAGQGRLQMLSSISDAIAVQICRGNSEEFALHLQTVLSSRSGEEVREYLAGKNISWISISGGKQDSWFDSPEINLGNLLEDSLKPGPGDEKPRITPPTPTTKDAPARKPLPLLQDVRLGHELATGRMIAGKGTKGLGSGGYGGGSTRLPDTEYDRVLGRRGEELVYLEELKKVEANGFDKSRVVWTSKDDPLAPWDILSVDAAGCDIWIEVKATTGRDGRFVWSAAEFRAAVAKGDRYVLVRIYEVDGTNPTRKDFPNPIRLLQNGTLNLEVGSLSAEVEGL